MTKIVLFVICVILFIPIISKAEFKIGKPGNTAIISSGETAVLSWINPDSLSFAKTVLFRSAIPIEDYFTYEAVEELCDKIYEGKAETFTDNGLAVNLPYYYILFALDRQGTDSGAVVLKKKAAESSSAKNLKTENNGTLSGAASNIVNEVSKNEAGIIYNFNRAETAEENSDDRRLALFIIVKSPNSLTENDKNAISYFIHAGTPTTIFLGSGERAGVLNSYLSVFDKLPTTELEWQDIIKIANGRWPDERNLESETQASNIHFNAIYKRTPNLDDPNDNAAVTVIAYGLRPAMRNLDSEKNAIKIYRDIFNHSPVEASDWDLVRAIAYSGATR